VLGIGGGGDVVGSLAIARRCQELETPFVVGGVAWERLPVDPKPGPRPANEIRDADPLGRHALLARAQTATVDGVRFSESHVAEMLGVPTVLIDITGGAPGAAEGIAAASQGSRARSATRSCSPPGCGWPAAWTASRP